MIQENQNFYTESIKNNLQLFYTRYILDQFHPIYIKKASLKS